MRNARKRSDSFSLTKWYLDCVTGGGEVTIVYGTELNWRGIRLVANSVLTGSKDDVETRTSISPYQITQAGSRITVEIPKQGVTGEWEADSAACERVVYAAKPGSVNWKCLQPRSRVRLRLNGRELSGLGYAESTTLTVPPWKLPLHQLRWGRFVSPGNWMVWVDWKGPYNASFAIADGKECATPAIGETGVATCDATLCIDSGFALRAGRIGSTIMPHVPAIRTLLPRSLFKIEERKWCSAGEMRTQSNCSTGWVIHEVVHWKV